MNQDIFEKFQRGDLDFLLGALFFLMAVGVFFMFLARRSEKKNAADIQRYARDLSASRWVVKEGGDLENMGYMLILKRKSNGNVVHIPFRPAHPSIRTLRWELRVDDEVRLIFTEKPHDSALETEACAYLLVERVK